MDLVLENAFEVVRLSKLLRKKQRFYNKRKLNKKQKKLAIARLVISTAMRSAQIHMIMQTPIPKFKGGASSGIAIHGCQGEEKII